jgi:hypothetical protein
VLFPLLLLFVFGPPVTLTQLFRKSHLVQMDEAMRPAQALSYGAGLTSVSA